MRHFGFVVLQLLLASGCLYDWREPIELVACECDGDLQDPMVKLPVAWQADQELFVQTSSELESALATATAGTHIVLKNGTTFQGSFTVNFSGNDAKGLTIRSESAAELGPHCRRPEVQNLPRLESDDPARPVLEIAANSRSVRIQGLAIAYSGASERSSDMPLVVVGGEATDATRPQDIALIQLELTGSGAQRDSGALWINGSQVFVLGSRMTGFDGPDGPRVAPVVTLAGGGPIVVAYNEISGEDEFVRVGSSSATSAPSHVMVAYNFGTRSDPTDGPSTRRRALIAIEAVERATIRGNQFRSILNNMENAGPAIDIRQEQVTSLPAQDITVVANDLFHSGYAVGVPDYFFGTFNNLVVKHNLLRGASPGYVYQLYSSADTSFERNTFVRGTAVAEGSADLTADKDLDKLTFKDNVVDGLPATIVCSGGCSYRFQSFFSGNIVVRDGDPYPGADNVTFPDAMLFKDYSAGDYRLSDAVVAQYPAYADKGVDFSLLDQAAQCREPL